jgi:hypothetical protein
VAPKANSKHGNNSQIRELSNSAPCAQTLAEAQVELQRVWGYRARLLSALPTPDEAAPSEQGEAISKIVGQLVTAARYERRALARRNKAIQQAQKCKVSSSGIGFVLPGYNDK